jgi:hypothetical protein
MTGEPESEDEGAPSPETERVRAQIERTREGMSQTIDAIQARLSPARVASDAADAMKDATMDYIGELRRAVARQPVPAVLLGFGASALVTRALAGSRRHGAALRAPTSRGVGRQLLIVGAFASVLGWGLWKARNQERDGL